MLMSMFVVIMALAMVMLSFYVLRTSVTWLTNQVGGSRGGPRLGGSATRRSPALLVFCVLLCLPMTTLLIPPPLLSPRSSQAALAAGVPLAAVGGAGAQQPGRPPAETGLPVSLLRRLPVIVFERPAGAFRIAMQAGALERILQSKWAISLSACNLRQSSSTWIIYLLCLCYNNPVKLSASTLIQIPVNDMGCT